MVHGCSGDDVGRQNLVRGSRAVSLNFSIGSGSFLIRSQLNF